MDDKPFVSNVSLVIIILPLSEDEDVLAKVSLLCARLHCDMVLMLVAAERMGR